MSYVSGSGETAVIRFSDKQRAEFERQVAKTWGAVDVVCRRLGSEVISCSDEWFGEAARLVHESAPVREAGRFTEAGAWYDGWETRRHNPAPYDWVIIKLGVYSARIVGCEVDTAYFDGNHAPSISVDALRAETGPVEEDDPRWAEVVPRVECGPSRRHFFLRKHRTDAAYTHVKLKMYPDGGIARFRLYGQVLPVPASGLYGTAHQDGSFTINLAGVHQGAVALQASDQHFGNVENLLLPGRGHDMSDGWETRRSREPGHCDWAIIRLARRSHYLSRIVVDTIHFRGNFPQYVTVHGICKDSPPEHDDPGWQLIVDRSATGPDQEHEYAVDKFIFLTHVKLTIIPDGGVKRLCVWGY
ncbi:AER162Cp [Eremothecium gossypii ATCC 10895]|uniref:allantoicase n=1 Tax=Eremothecium gossypii (strain ATCC 10895 / CBS 109.51 / FGSC 9923 / NRRL Y-1056) TaxID=284811 RepID=Q756U0_EREGS|nr:AER162Cp [Eremothecium gossypii ATCC 10895]AAS52844.1 AER162Cp [Eremothecium gossypii ATCC 10895]AEY97151.1 FAER162Cp [Eremothecium gossypii FDAG1]